MSSNRSGGNRNIRKNLIDRLVRIQKQPLKKRKQELAGLRAKFSKNGGLEKISTAERGRLKELLSQQRATFATQGAFVLPDKPHTLMLFNSTEHLDMTKGQTGRNTEEPILINHVPLIVGKGLSGLPARIRNPKTDEEFEIVFRGPGFWAINRGTTEQPLLKGLSLNHQGYTRRGREFELRPGRYFKDAGVNRYAYDRGKNNESRFFRVDTSNRIVFAQKPAGGETPIGIVLTPPNIPADSDIFSYFEFPEELQGELKELVIARNKRPMWPVHYELQWPQQRIRALFERVLSAARSAGRPMLDLSKLQELDDQAFQEALDSQDRSVFLWYEELLDFSEKTPESVAVGMLMEAQARGLSAEIQARLWRRAIITLKLANWHGALLPTHSPNFREYGLMVARLNKAAAASSRATARKQIYEFLEDCERFVLTARVSAKESILPKWSDKYLASLTKDEKTLTTMQSVRSLLTKELNRDREQNLPTTEWSQALSSLRLPGARERAVVSLLQRVPELLLHKKSIPGMLAGLEKIRKHAFLQGLTFKVYQPVRELLLAAREVLQKGQVKSTVGRNKLVDYVRDHVFFSTMYSLTSAGYDLTPFERYFFRQTDLEKNTSYIWPYEHDPRTRNLPKIIPDLVDHLRAQVFKNHPELWPLMVAVDASKTGLAEEANMHLHNAVSQAVAQGHPLLLDLPTVMQRAYQTQADRYFTRADGADKKNKTKSFIKWANAGVAAAYKGERKTSQYTQRLILAYQKVLAQLVKEAQQALKDKEPGKAEQLLETIDNLSTRKGIPLPAQFKTLKKALYPADRQTLH